MRDVRLQYFLSFGMIGTVLPYVSVFFRQAGLSEARVGYAWAIWSLAVMVSPVVVTMLADARVDPIEIFFVAGCGALVAWFGIKHLLLLAMVFTALRLGLIAATTSPWIVVGTQVFHGIFLIAVGVLPQVVLDDAADDHYRHSMQGVYVMRMARRRQPGGRPDCGMEPARPVLDRRAAMRCVGGADPRRLSRAGHANRSTRGATEAQRHRCVPGTRIRRGGRLTW